MADDIIKGCIKTTGAEIEIEDGGLMMMPFMKVGPIKCYVDIGRRTGDLSLTIVFPEDGLEISVPSKIKKSQSDEMDKIEIDRMKKKGMTDKEIESDKTSVKYDVVRADNEIISEFLKSLANRILKFRKGVEREFAEFAKKRDKGLSQAIDEAIEERLDMIEFRKRYQK